ncbi:dihydroorotate dehydrogenase electron transfer subunit [Clostridium sp. JNZ J1-5]
MIYSQKKVKKNIEISKDIFELTIEGNFEAKPGQFYMLKAWEDGLILPRPISVNALTDNSITFLYAAVGKGTKILSKLTEEDSVQIMGPLGNGFNTDEINGKVAIVAGGIGIAPMIYLIKQLKGCNLDLYAGFRDIDYCIDELKEYVNSVNIATESGRNGYKGYVTDLIKVEDYDVVICCGPEVMMEKVVKMCNEKNIPVYASMEKRMACGVGACLVCTCKTSSGNKRTCKDGPVFNGRDLIFND